MSTTTRTIGDATIYIGDCLNSLQAMPDMSVQTCVTSPPYFGLRDYGMEGQLGLEQMPDQYIAKMVEVFREVRRVLRDDGTLWVNIGDSYARDSRVRWDSTIHAEKDWKVGQAMRNAPNLVRDSEGYKPKDLIGIPWMLAFALRADGWYLRQDIIWNKPSPMPESVRDRCTKSHEYIFLMSKSERYFFDYKAMREPAVMKPQRRNKRAKYDAPGAGEHRKGTQYLRGEIGTDSPDGMRNRRSVWTVATRPYKGAHFATFPPALIEPCILAGSRPGDIVLDPFLGSGTTAAVALQHGRKAVGLELNPAYVDLAAERIEATRRIHTAASNDAKAAPVDAANDSQTDLFAPAEVAGTY